MIGGLIVVVVVLAVASAAGFGLRLRQGRFQPQKSKSSAGGTDPADSRSAASPDTASPGTASPGTASPGTASPGTVLTAADLGAPLGERATLVQFSTEFCTYCGPTRALLAEVARERDGVAFVEIDAAERMDLTRRLHVLSTPTVLVLDHGGAIGRRTSGQPRKPDLLAAVNAVSAGTG